MGLSSRELRIGNYVRYGDEYNCVICSLGHTFATDQRHLNKGKVGLLTGSDDIIEYDGIPLTEDWLLKFGFSKYDKTANLFMIQDWWDFTDLYYLKDFNIGVNDDGFSFVFTEGFDAKERSTIYKIGRRIEFVHQLQNLYFALTADELVLS